MRTIAGWVLLRLIILSRAMINGLERDAETEDELLEVEDLKDKLMEITKPKIVK